MKWQSDTIQQFVRYKIEHPEQSYQCLRDYHMQKRQSQHLEKMCKHLQQLKATKDYFLHQLHKLKQIAQNQVSRNQQDVNKIDKKCDAIMQKYNQMKTKRNTQVKKTKTQIINEYEKQVQGIRLSHEGQIRVLQQEINRVSEEIGVVSASGWKQQLGLKIASTLARIEQYKSQCGQKMMRQKLLKSSAQQLRQRQTALDQKHLQLQLIKQHLQQKQAKQKRSQDEQFSQMKLFISQFHQQLIDKISITILQLLSPQSQQYRSTYTITRQSQPLSTVKQIDSIYRKSSVQQQRPTEVMLFNPNIDFNYVKKGRGGESPKKQQQKLESLLLNQDQDVMISTQKDMLSQQRENQRMANNIVLFKQFINKIRQQNIISHHNEPLPPGDHQSISNAQNYISIHYNYSTENLHLKLDQMIQSQKDKLQSYRDQSQLFITSQNTKLTAQQAALNKKEKELDKEIHHLQNKVQRTEQEIAKKKRVAI